MPRRRQRPLVLCCFGELSLWTGDVSALIFFFQQSGLLFIGQTVTGLLRSVLIPLLNLQLTEGSKTAAPCLIAGWTTLQGLVFNYSIPFFLAFLFAVMLLLHRVLCARAFERVRSARLVLPFLTTV